MRFLPVLVLATALPLGAQSVVSEPIGFNKVTCLANSDTIVGVPLRKEGSRTTKLSGAPTGTGDAITLPVTATLTAGELTKHYVKFTSGAKDGYWFDVTSNTTDSVTIDLNGADVIGAGTGDTMVITEYWTLDTLFPPALATTNPATTGHAIVASVSSSPAGRRTQILLPNNGYLGTNRPSVDVYYIASGGWQKSGGSATPPGATILYPDSSFTIRHNASVAASTVFRVSGEVLLTNQTVVLNSRPLTQGYNDNHVSLLRPVDVSLKNLNIVQSGAFMSSTGTSPGTRRDQILVFNNGIAQTNKPADKIYYHINYVDPGLTDKWVLAGDTTNASQDDTVIPAGAGIIVRKYNTSGGVSSYWQNTPPYPSN